MVQITLSSASFGVDSVTAEMFGTNFLSRFYRATEDGNFAQAMDRAGVTGLRFPGGAMTEESFLVTNPNRAVDDEGRKLVPLNDFLDFAKAIGSEVTIVLPTRGLFGSDADSLGNRYIDPLKVEEVRVFVVNLLTDLRTSGDTQVIDLIRAFEIGNEYWGSGLMTSSEYGRVVNALAPVIAQATLEVLGPGAVGEIGILVQMGGPWGSEFDQGGLYGSLNASSAQSLLLELGIDASDFGPNGSLRWDTKLELCNADIIEQISPEAKAAITGLVEHFYLTSPAENLIFTSDTVRYIDDDLQRWRAAGYNGLDLAITEWNVMSKNEAQFGLKGAGALLFLFESMMQLGVDQAFSWPLLSSRTTELAGGLNGQPYLTPAGAALSHMSEHLEGLQLMNVDDTTPGLEISAYGSQSRIVLYLSSRDADGIDLEANVAGLLQGFSLSSAEMIEADMTTSDEKHMIDGRGMVSVPYWNEHDVKAIVVDLDEAKIYSGSTITASIGAYQVLMLVFDRSEILSPVSYTMPTGSLALTLIGSSAINGIGNTFDNIIRGNGSDNQLSGGLGNDTLIGNGGADTLIGGDGDDVYLIDNRDIVIEAPESGIDRVEAAFNMTLGANLENLTLMGTTPINGVGNTLSNQIIGNSAANQLTGKAGNDTLIGHSGVDTLIGGAGDDTYITDGADVLIETSNSGVDHVISTGSIVLAANIENLTLTGISPISGNGNKLNNNIVGNAAANHLAGGHGNDTYTIDLLDTLVESPNQGIDTVISAFSYVLGPNFENLILVGVGNTGATGNSLNNTLTGNSGNNILNGGKGKDVLIGGVGDDTYYTDGNDQFVELADQGTDTVYASVNHTLFDNIENLSLTGSKNTWAVGNALNNAVTGNSGNNTLQGLAGDDTLIGGAGSDSVFGGEGQDCFVFDSALSATNVDAVRDFVSEDDTIYLSQGIFNSLDVGELSILQFVANTSGRATNLTQRVIYETDTGKLYYDEDGSGAKAATLFAVLQPGLSLVNSDFLVL